MHVQNQAQHINTSINSTLHILISPEVKKSDHPPPSSHTHTHAYTHTAQRPVSFFSTSQQYYTLLVTFSMPEREWQTKLYKWHFNMFSLSFPWWWSKKQSCLLSHGILLSNTIDIGYVYKSEAEWDWAESFLNIFFLLLVVVSRSSLWSSSPDFHPHCETPAE